MTICRLYQKNSSHFTKFIKLNIKLQTSISKRFKFTFGSCLKRLLSLRKIKKLVEQMTLTMFDESNKGHYNICLQVILIVPLRKSCWRSFVI